MQNRRYTLLELYFNVHYFMECRRMLLTFPLRVGCDRSFREPLRLLSLPQPSEFPSFLSIGRSKIQQQVFSLQLHSFFFSCTQQVCENHILKVADCLPCILGLKSLNVSNFLIPGALKVWNVFISSFFPSLSFCFSSSAAFYLSTIN